MTGSELLRLAQYPVGAALFSLLPRTFKTRLPAALQAKPVWCVTAISMLQESDSCLLSAWLRFDNPSHYPIGLQHGMTREHPASHHYCGKRLR